MSANENNNKVFVINLVKDFGSEPYGRWPSHGPLNGEKFRQTILLPALRANELVKVELSGASYNSSFLEEAFGGLVRFGYFTSEELLRRLITSHPLPSNIERVSSFIRRATFNSSIGERAEVESRYKLPA